MYEIHGLDDEEFSKHTRLRDELCDRFRQGNIIVPPVPRLALELNRLSDNPNIDEAVKLAERDSQLAGRIIHVASSPIFGYAAPPEGIRGAVVRLGIEGLRNIVTSILVAQQFRCPPLAHRMHRLSQHGYVVGTCSALLCRELGLEPSKGFLAGLMHDVGRSVILHLLALFGRRDKDWLSPEVVAMTLDDLHADAGSLVCARWGLDIQVKHCAAHHHDRLEPAESKRLVAAVALADSVDRLLYGEPAEDQPEDVDGIEQDPEAQRQAVWALPQRQELGLNLNQCQELIQAAANAHSDPVVRQLAAA